MTGSVEMVFRLVCVLLLMTFLVLLDPSRVLAAPDVQGDLAVVAGYRLDDFTWNIAGDGNGEGPNILSELTWRDLQIYQVGLAGSAERVGPDALFVPCLRVVAGYGLIVDGENQDSDYLGDNRTLEFSRSNNSADAGSVFDFSLAGGGKFFTRDRRYSFAPLLGFSFYAQNLTLRDGYQTVSDAVLFPETLPLGPFTGLDSTYSATWFGPWLGLDVAAVPVPAWTFSAGMELHQFSYRAEANWNLRSDLAHPKSFEHIGNGYGLIYRIGSGYALTARLELILSAELRRFAVRDGADRVFLADGSQGATRLNEVKWDSQMLTAGILYHY